jgi:hypothetical protein
MEVIVIESVEGSMTVRRASGMWRGSNFSGKESFVTMLCRLSTRLLVALCVTLIAVSAFAQFQTGNIYGKVQAKDGSALPGVTVTLTGVGAPQTAITGAQGDFRFLNLSPGTYSLKAELAGFGSAARTGIGVRVGANADVTMVLNPAVSESITVTGEAPLLDVRKAGTAINVTKVELERIPTSRDPWTILQQAPGVLVDRINVGGNQSGQQSNYIGKGASGAQNTWNVDGVNITDEGATGSSPTYYDFDAFEEMQVTTGGSDPRIQTPGVQLNMVTKRGTNDLRGSGRYFYTPGRYQADATVPSEAAGYLIHTDEVNYLRDYGGEVGGPIWRDHLWFWGAIAENKISGVKSAFVTAPTDVFDNIILRDKNFKLNGQLAPSNSGVAFYSFGDKVRNARSLSPFRPFETSWHQSGPTKIYKIEDTQIFGTSLYLTGMASKVDGGFRLDPNGGLGPSAPTAWRGADTVWHGNFAFYNTDRPQRQYRLDGSKFFDAGIMNHELKFGFGYRKTPVTSSSGWPGATQGYWRFRSAGYCNARGLDAGCAQGRLFRDSNKSMSEKINDIYVGDTIIAGNLTLQAGLRWDQQRGRNEPSAAPANPVLATPLTGIPGCAPPNICQLPSVSYGGDSRTLKWSAVSPRLGLTYALGGDKKTLLRASYNRYVNQLGSTILNANLFQYYSYFVFLGFDKNGDRMIQRDELQRLQSFYYVDPTNPASTTPLVRLDYGMKPPKTDEFILGFERELMTDFSVGVNYSYRRYTDILETRPEKHRGQGDFYTAEDYVVGGMAGGTFTDENGKVIQTPLVPFYVLKTGIDAPVYYVIRNRPDYRQTYNGIDLSATKRLTNRWMLRGNITYNDWKQHAGTGSYYDPTPRITSTAPANQAWCLGTCSGPVIERSAGSGAFKDVFINSKWSLNLTGLYQLPWDFSVGASLTGRQGYPKIWRDEVTVDNGVDDVVLNKIGSVRFPNVYELDLRAAKDFRFMNRIGLTLSADLFNVPNKRTVLQRETLIFFDGSPNSSGNRIEELQSPRIWRFGARVNF